MGEIYAHKTLQKKSTISSLHGYERHIYSPHKCKRYTYGKNCTKCYTKCLYLCLQE